MMVPSRANRILEDWSAVAGQARRPAGAPRPVVVRSSLPGATLAGAGLVVVALVFAGLLLGRPGPNGAGGISSPTPPDPTATASPSAATPSETGPTPAPTPAPTTGPCGPETVDARITMWEGAAGHRIAHVELTNTGSERCILEAMAKPQLIDGLGSVLIDGSSPPSSAFLEIAPGDVVKTLVQDGNYCGPAPAPPVSVAFVLSDDGWIVASPVSPTDGTVPPCIGAGSAADIEMQPWAP